MKEIIQCNREYYRKREEAIKWWNSLHKKQRQLKVDFHYPGRHFNSLTGREIQLIAHK